MTAVAAGSSGTTDAAGPPALPGGALVSYQGFDFELVPEQAGSDPDAIARLSPSVLHIAACSRGWTTPAEIAELSLTFKLQGLLDADALALVWREGRLVGVAGMVYRLPLERGAIVHLCSVGFLPEAQNRGFMPTLFGLLWEVISRLPRLAGPYRSGEVYLTAITQSPYLMGFLAAVSELQPAPGRPPPDARTLEVARVVHERFDPEIELDRRTLVLREECEFFYRKVPYGTSREINQFCDSRLRYAAGDTFLAVGRVDPQVIDRLVEVVQRRDPVLFLALRNGLPPLSRRSA